MSLYHSNSFQSYLCFQVVSFRGQNLLKPRPDWSPLGVKFKICDKHPRLFHMGVPPGEVHVRRPYMYVLNKYNIHVAISK